MRYTDGFTGKAILALKEAICAAEELGHTYIGSEHLLLGLLEEGSNAAAAMLAAQHITAQRVRNALVELVGRGIPAQVQEDCLTPALSEIMQQAKAFSKEDGRSLAGTEHLLRSILRTPCCTAVAILKKLGVSLNQSAGNLLSYPYGGTANRANFKENTAESLSVWEVDD